MSKVYTTDQTEALVIASGTLTAAVDRDGNIRISNAERPDIEVWLTVADFKALSAFVVSNESLCSRETTHCTWCDAPIDTENSLSELCDDCVETSDEQDADEAAEARELAYWRHVDQKIDEARGK